MRGFVAASMFWQYIAPHRIRIDQSTQPGWDEIQDLSIQRLARVLEFQTTVAFVGSGCSAALGYPAWKGLLPTSDPKRPFSLDISLRSALENDKIDCPSAFQIAFEASEGGTFRKTLIANIANQFNTARDEVKNLKAMSPYAALMDFPIRRYITTNYDRELEIALKEKRGPRSWVASGSFDQTAQGILPIFSVALAPASRYTVFHCHGALDMDPREEKYALEQQQFSRTAVLTEDDYKRWYLSEEPESRAFREVLDTALYSNPLFMIGYSLSDADLVRMLRHIAVRQDPRPTASEVFVLIDRKPQEEEPFWEIKFRGWQTRFGINVLDYIRKTGANGKGSLTLAAKLSDLRKTAEERRRQWRGQPRARRLENPTGYILNPAEPHDEHLFGDRTLKDDALINQIRERLKTEPVVILEGPFGSAKYLKLCQFVHAEFPSSDGKSRKYRDFAFFSAHGNEDVYSYIKRIAAGVERAMKSAGIPASTLHETKKPARSPVETISLLLSEFPRNRGFILLISGIERFLDCPSQENPDLDSTAALKPRNTTAQDFLTFLQHWSNGGKRGNRIILTTRSHLPGFREEAPIVLDERAEPFRAIGSASDAPLGLAPTHYGQLRWQLQDQHAALAICAAFLNNTREDERPSALRSLMTTLSSASSERGTRLIKHVIREQKDSNKCEILLTLLSYFNRPFRREVRDYALKLDSPDVEALTALTPAKIQPLFDWLVKLRLIESVRKVQIPDEKETHEPLYIVPPLVKKYCRTIVAGTAQTESRSFGLHGYTARGPFFDPGNKKPGLARALFSHFERGARKAVMNIGTPPGELETPRRLTRATFEILRGTFTCNSVARWGKFSEYIEMCAKCFDLVKNYSQAANILWTPSEFVGGGAPEDFFHTHAPLTFEEIVWILNELGLAYYSEGTIQDAINVWGLAIEWQKALDLSDPAQSGMYAASLNCHLGAANMHIGRMQIAREYFGKASEFAKGNADLKARLRGFQARVDHFEGNTVKAAKAYHETVTELEELGNRRAQSYFMRHEAALLIRNGHLDQAERRVRAAMSIAASENYPDYVAYSHELLAKILRRRGKWRSAIREYRIAQDDARKMGLYRLETDVLLGLASIQLHQGDATASRRGAFAALERANECLLVQRQIKALMIIGRATVDIGEKALGVSYVARAVELAASSGFRLTEMDSRRLLAQMGGARDNPEPV